MKPIRLKHMNAFPDRHGAIRHYFRFPGRKAVKIEGEPGSVPFMLAYQAALNDLPDDAKDVKKHRGPAADDRTINALAKYYFETEFTHLTAASSKKKNRGIINRFCAKHGHRHAGKIEFVHINAIHAGMAETPAAANDMLLRVGVLMRLAMKMKWRTDDPTVDVKPFETGSYHTWTDDELAMFKARWAVGTPERTVFALLFWTSQRISDVAAMKWSDYSEVPGAGTIRVQQKKSRDKKKDRVLMVAVDDELAAVLAAWRETLRSGERKVSALARGDGPVVITAYGVAFTDGGLSAWFADKIEAAGLPDRCVSHGLRKAFLRTAAEAGATNKEMQAQGGHRNTRELDLYTDAANQPNLARGAIDKIRAKAAKGD